MTKVWRLIRPLLLFPLLFIPYMWLNRAVIVEWLGCGCVDGFNANHFTALFWGVIVVLVTTLCCLSARHIRRRSLRIVYIALSILLSLCFWWLFSVFMHWN